MEDKKITVKEAAEILGMTRQGVFLRVKKGLISHTKFGKMIMLNRFEVEKFKGKDLRHENQGRPPIVMEDPPI